MSCWICGASQNAVGAVYLQCSSCRHMILSRARQTHIVNAPLDRKEFARADAKDRYQINLSEELTGKGLPAVVLDVGCGPGRFLYFMKQRGHTTYGIEVTESCIQFARRELGIQVAKSVYEASRRGSSFDLITAWHSLEHFPVSALTELFDGLSQYGKDSTALVVCVPNSDSVQWKLFGEKWLYYDYPNHIHQFSFDSLRTFLGGQGWKVTSVSFSWNYAFWGNLLSFANLVTSKHNFIYYLLKRKESTDGSKLKTFCIFIASLFMMLIGLIPSIIMTAIEAIFPSKSGVITLCCHRAKLSNS